jgi:hypothetical protein
MWVSDDERIWVRRLALGIVLVTCIGGGAFILVSRPHGDCVAVGDMMRTYREFQAATAPTLLAGAANHDDLIVAADAEARTAQTLHGQARGIGLPELRAAAVSFADGVARSARVQRDEAGRPADLDPFIPILPEMNPGELKDADTFFDAAHIMLIACPSAPRPIGIG